MRCDRPVADTRCACGYDSGSAPVKIRTVRLGAAMGGATDCTVALRFRHRLLAAVTVADVRSLREEWVFSPDTYGAFTLAMTRRLGSRGVMMQF